LKEDSAGLDNKSISKYEPVLDLAALFLGLINGLMLLRAYLRDRAVLRVKPVHPNVYQWFFRLPGRQHLGKTTRRYGFLAYVAIANRGRRDVCLTAWRLKGRTKGWRGFETCPLSIQEPQVPLGDGVKIYPVLGIKGPNFSGETLVKAGSSISGFCYYIVEFFGSPYWDIRIRGDKTVVASLVVRNVFEQTTRAKVRFREIPFETAEAMVPDIANVNSRDSDTDTWSEEEIF
jgi:hypothetical protein